MIQFGVDQSKLQVRQAPAYNEDVYGVVWDQSSPDTALTRTGNAAYHQSLPLQTRMRRCLLKSDGEVTYYLDPRDSHYRAGTSPTVTGTAEASDILKLADTGAFGSVQEGQYARNLTTGTYSKITAVTDNELALLPIVETTRERWGITTDTTTYKLVDIDKDFTTMDVQPGMIAWNRADDTFAEITGVSATELDVSDDIFATGDQYSILDRNFSDGDEYEICTARFDGSDGQVMVEIPKFYYRWEFNTNQHHWQIATQPRDGFSPHPAFVKPDGTERDAVYLSAFEGVIGNEGKQQNNELTSYNLSGDALQSLPGYQTIVNGQRSEFRQTAENNGSGWQLEDWYTRWAVQLLFIIEFADLNSQAVLGDGFTDWSGGTRDDYVTDTSTRVIGLTGFSLLDGNFSNNISEGDGYVGSYNSYRGIENFWGQIWKWIDGVNYLDGRVYLANDASAYQDDTGSGAYSDTGFDQPTTNDYITAIHESDAGFLVKSVGGSSSTYLADYYWYGAGWRVARAGGTLNTGDQAGFAALVANGSSSSRNSTSGARVCFRKN